MNAQKLMKDIDKKLANWDERSSFTMKGVKNLSRVDLEMLKLYVEQYEKQGNFDGLMKPLGDIKKVLEAYEK